MKLKHAVEMTAGGTPDVSDSTMWADDPDGVPWVAIGDMSSEEPVRTTDRRISVAGMVDRRLTPKPSGTVLFAMYASVGAVAILKTEAVWNQALLGLTPRGERADGRFLAHWLRHLKNDLGSLTRTSTQANLNAEQVGNLPFTDIRVDEQRRIADFLDDQVARIDEIIRLREEQVATLDGRIETAADQALIERGWHQPATLEVQAVQPLPTGWRVAALSQVLHQLTNGYVGPTRDILVDDGIRYVQSLHIKGGRIDFDRRRFYVTPEWHAARPRIHLREDDVLIVQTGDIGRVAVVPPHFGEASCHALQIARVRPEIVSGSYLGAYLGSSFGYHSLLSRATGALHPHLEGGIRSVPIVIPPTDVQAEVVVDVERTRNSASAAQQEMRAQVDLLQVRKRSLITAAVTGEFDVTTASGRGVA